MAGPVHIPTVQLAKLKTHLIQFLAKEIIIADKKIYFISI